MFTIEKQGPRRPCQGVQKVGMIDPWLEAFPRTAAPIIDEIDSVLGYSLTRIIREGPNSLLSSTPHAQPAIMATSVLILRILETEFCFDIAERIDFTLGHSLGEFAALVASGHLRFEDALWLYGMVAIVTEPDHLPRLVEAVEKFVAAPRSGRADSGGADSDVPPIQQVLIANANSRNQIVLSGNIERIKTLVAHLRQFLGHDPRAVRLNSDSPFHSPIMRPAVATMHGLLAGKSRTPGMQDEDMVTFPGRVQCVSNVSARPFESREELKDLLARSCLETVRWWDSIRYLDQQEKVRRWIGIGPGKVGRNLVGKEVGMRGTDAVKGGGVWAVTDPSEIHELLRGLEETDPLLEEEERIIGDEP
ncbi:Malonyl CoA-acyl carrier protein transacylase [Cytospora mali]|uniref:[acyl-carrier-protein] S-malonyltransferase n=1 Tax=Cytospora mali TaxID=578113 RepID=A0A194UY46_CYTMA|nr:Malonyl CoA-acyl carrier protein transacylase [Valsa mali var. pyri (nom. inval.)]